MGKITTIEKWDAVIGCNKQYDGLFYYAVKSTGIFCRPSCKAKTPLKKNILFFNSVDEAINAGFRPCKICRPDINEHIYEPNKILIEKAKDMLTLNYNSEFNLKCISQEIGISESYFRRLFKQYYSLTPNEYIFKIRINRSMDLLSKTDLDIVEIAYEVGFKSLSNFYKYFKEQVGYTPKEYRKRNNINEGSIR